jgi:hypothetical protein
MSTQKKLPTTGTGTDGAREIILTTSQMAFFIFNVFGHDIIHDAHPAMGAGSDRLFGVLTKDAKKELVDITSSDKQSLSFGSEESTKTKSTKKPKAPKAGGGFKENAENVEKDENEDYEAIIEMIDDEDDKKIIDKSVEDIVTSVGETLVKRNMLYAIEYKKQIGDELSFKDFQQKTFIIIDAERIAKNFSKNVDDPTYPGDIYYKGKRIQFWKIEVSETRTDYVVKWNEDKINYTVTINKQNYKASSDIKKEDVIFYNLNITENNNNNTMLGFFILCPEEIVNLKPQKCSSLKRYIKALGNDFFYNTFVTFMENETYNNINGVIQMFPEYILKKETNYNMYEPFFTEFLDKIRNYDGNITVIFNAYKKFYVDFLIPFRDFYGKTQNIEPKYIVDNNFILPNTFDEVINDNLMNKNRNKYNTILAEIFAGYFNKLEGAENIYEKKIVLILKKMSCNIDFMYVKNFFRMSSLYFKLEIIEPILPPVKGGKKRFNQLGGNKIDNIMTNEQKEVLASDSSIDKKYEKIMNNVKPYSGLEQIVINNYFDVIMVPFNYVNVFNISLNIVNSITIPDTQISLQLQNAKNAWIPLFDLANFPISQNYFSKINESLLTTKSLDEIKSMPPTRKEDVMPIFKADCRDEKAIDNSSNESIKILSQDIKNVLIQIYNFEQAFIVQLKIFLLYIYNKLSKTKKPMVTPSQDKIDSFYINFKTNFQKYFSIIKIMVELKMSKSSNFSQVQQINSGCMVSSSVGVISYCINKIPSTQINRIKESDLDNEISLLETIYLKKNLKKGSTSGDIDDKLINHFKKMISSNKFGFNGNSSYTISNSNSVKGNKAKIMESIKLPSIQQNQLYLINNAINTEGISNFFCPYSSILDGQATCSSYNGAIENGNPIEEGTINIIVRDSNPETMRYHVRVKKSDVPGEWSNTKISNTKILKISAYLKIKDIVLINKGFSDVDTYNHKDKNDNTKIDKDKGPDNAIEVNLNETEKSPFDAKVCLRNIMENNIKLLTIPGSPATPDTTRTWEDFLKIINEDGNPGEEISTTYGNISRNLFRRKIIQTSFIKSLGDYLQEINTIADNAGYIDSPTSTTSNGNNVLLPPNTFRLGLSNDRPSGVRIASLLLFALSGINPNAIGGYYTIRSDNKGSYSGNYVIASRNKGLLTNSGKTIAGGSIKKYNITKRDKNITNKRKNILKSNKKKSKKNKKGTKKRK